MEGGLVSDEVRLVLDGDQTFLNGIQGFLLRDAEGVEADG